MNNSPRHACGRPLVCPGPCNPRLKLHHHHHHHHHHHRRQKQYMSSDVMSEDTPILQQELPEISLMRSWKLNGPSTPGSSSADKSISELPSLVRAALLNVSPVPKTTQPSKTDITILRKVLSRRKVEIFGEPSTKRNVGELLSQKKSEETAAARDEMSIETPASGAARTLDNMKTIVIEGLNRLKCKRVSTVFRYLIILTLYAGIHVLLAVTTWQTFVYRFFVCSQICGVLAFLMWKITGTILI